MTQSGCGTSALGHRSPDSRPASAVSSLWRSIRTAAGWQPRLRAEAFYGSGISLPARRCTSSTQTHGMSFRSPSLRMDASSPQADGTEPSSCGIPQPEMSSRQSLGAPAGATWWHSAQTSAFSRSYLTIGRSRCGISPADLRSLSSLGTLVSFVHWHSAQMGSPSYLAPQTTRFGCGMLLLETSGQHSPDTLKQSGPSHSVRMAGSSRQDLMTVRSSFGMLSPGANSRCSASRLVPSTRCHSARMAGFSPAGSQPTGPRMIRSGYSTLKLDWRSVRFGGTPTRSTLSCSAQMVGSLSQGPTMARSACGESRSDGRGYRGLQVSKRVNQTALVKRSSARMGFVS